MRFDFENRWLRVLIEFCPRAMPMRRYRVPRADMKQARGRMIRRISRHLRYAADST